MTMEETKINVDKGDDIPEAKPLLHNLPSDITTRLGRFWITVQDHTINHQSLHVLNYRKHRDLQSLFEDPANVMSTVANRRASEADSIDQFNKSEAILDRLRAQAYHNKGIISEMDSPPMTPPNSGVATPYMIGPNQVSCAVGTDDEPDPWALPELADDDESKPWKEMTGTEKIQHVLLSIGKIIAFVILLYLFVCSLGLLGDAFKLLGGKATGAVFRESQLLKNPICGLMIGVLTTVLLQSSSTSTSIIVGLVASEILEVRAAIPIIMGANIGTSMTNTLVAMGQSGRRNEFRRAFAAATVHDMFNWLCVVILLPIEVATGYLYHFTDFLVIQMNLQKGEKPPELLKALTDPFTKLIVQLDKKVINQLALGEIGEDEKVSLVKRKCVEYVPVADYIKAMNGSFSDVETLDTVEVCKGPHIFGSIMWADSTIGVILLIASLITLCGCLFGIVKVLHSALKGQLARTIRRFVNNDLPGCFNFLTPWLAMGVGCVMTILVQSSSITTSALTPLVGVGILSLDRMYPLTLGANVGTTFTSVLAALASGHLEKSLQIAFCHLMFNLSGILLFFVVPITRKVPINAAKALGDITSQYRWFAVVYIVFSFFLIPLSIFFLSMISPWALLAVMLPVGLIVVFVVIVNILQSNRRHWLPEKLQSWQWLPKPLRSLEPYDDVMTSLLALFPCTRDAALQNQANKPDSAPMNGGILKATSDFNHIGGGSMAQSSVDLVDRFDGSSSGGYSSARSNNVIIVQPDTLPSTRDQAC